MKVGKISTAVLFYTVFFSSTLFALAPVSLNEPAFPALMGVNSPQTFTYTIINRVPNSPPLSITGYSGSVVLSSNACGSRLPSNGQCNFSVTITPTVNDVTSGIHQTLRVDYAGRTPLTSSININVAAPMLTLSAPNPAISSPMVDGKTQTVTYTLQNTGNVSSAPIRITGINAPISLTSGQDHCSGQILPVNASCTFEITIAPTRSENISQILSVSYGGDSLAMQRM